MFFFVVQFHLTMYKLVNKLDILMVTSQVICNLNYSVLTVNSLLIIYHLIVSLI
jgi:hypothetical protein